MSYQSALVAACAVLSAGGVGAADFTVSPGGRDTNPGTAAAPFATLTRARDAVRARILGGKLPAGGLTVELRAGNYELAEPLALDARDSGSEGRPVVWRSAPGAKVRVIGGRLVGGWTKVTDAAVLGRLDPAARGQVMQADLRAQGITRFGEMKSARGWGSSEAGLELFFNDQPTTLARWPNEGFTTIRDLPVMDFDVRGTKGSRQPIFNYEGDRPSRWAAEPEPMVHGYWFWDWADQRYRVKSVDPAKGLITLDAAGGEFRKGQWYYAYNLLCELDQPGEWYLDRASGILYFWPPSPIDRGQAMVSLLPNLVTMTGAADIELRGLTLEGCQGTAVSIDGGANCRVASCVVRNTGSYAVRVEGGRNHGVVGCDMYQMGDGGIVLHGGDKKTLTHAEHYAENNHIHHFSRWNPMYKVGIELFGVGMRASHNLVHHAPHVGISFCGQENTVEYNEVHNVVQQANDAGAIYSQPGIDEDWTMRGNVVRYNFVHHVYGYRGHGCCGVYLDDMFSSMHCYGNVFYQVPQAVFIGGGRDNITENNLFVECNPAVHVDARGLGWAAGGEALLRQRMTEIPYDKPPWSTRYPQLLTVLTDEPMAPKGNAFRRNINVGGKWDDIEGKARPMVLFEDNQTDQAPLIVDVKGLNFRLKPGSPAPKGWQTIPFGEIGLVKNADRASWPVAHAVEGAPAGATVNERLALRYPTPVAVPTTGVALTLKETPERAAISGPPCTAQLSHDGANLLVTVTVPIRDPAKLVRTDVWGSSDGVEVAFRDATDAKKPGVTWVLQGHATGTHRGSADAGATPAAATKLDAAGTFKAVVGADRWTATWSIPLAAAGLKPGTGLKLGFNIGVRRSETDEWIAWAGANGPNWQLDGTGVIVLR
ncbi:MAG: right-handed parallel beta-helix repeat-containing protein [Armatimonadetes bacterium]|nr:right-handed parallel beta-helix repeat-containing protein [Armatimonadota bacterium]